MLDELVRRIRSVFPTEKVIIPHMGRPSPKKEWKVRIVGANRPDEVEGMRDELKGSDILFISVKNLIGTDKEQFIRRLKVQCKQMDKHIYGMDRNWIFITGFEVECTPAGQ